MAKKQKKTSTKKAGKKRIKQNYRVIREVEDLYKQVNIAQTSKRNEIVRIIVRDETIFPVIENLLNDSEVSFTSKETNSGRLYEILYDKEIEEDPIVLDELEDEFIEEGQLF